jgi:NADH:ubiquinone oxidoreductase subunit E
MRKHFAPTPASEDARSIKRVSLEEELIIIDQANDNARCAEDRLAEVERLVDLKAALEDLAVIADQIEQPTPTELDLIDNCAQMAVAGTGLAPENLLKGPPLAVGQEIATEGWVDSAERLWHTVRAFMQRIWEHIDKFLKVHVVLPTIYARLGLALRQMKNRTGQLRYGARDEMEITAGINYLSNGLRVMYNANDLAKEFERFTKAVEMVYEANPARVEKLGKELTDTIDHWIGSNTDETRAKLIKAVKDANSTVGLPFPLPFTATEGDFKVKSSHEVLGCTYFKFMMYEDPVNGNDLGALDRLRNTGLICADGEDPRQDEIPFKHAGPQVYEKMLKDAQDMIQVVARFNKSGGAMKRLRAVAKALEVATDEAVKELKKQAPDDAVSLAYVKMMLNFNPAFARWVQQPAVAFYTKVIGVTRMLLMIVNHFNSLYEVKDKGEEQKIMAEMANATA